MNEQTYYRKLGAAAVRGSALRTGYPVLSEELADTPLDALTDEELDRLMDLGREAGVKLYRFKRSHEELPRIKAVLGFLRAVYPESLLDVGSGRGVFLFPFLDAFAHTRVTSFDILPHRVEFLNDLRLGGVENLLAVKADICTHPVPEKSVDVVTMLEVLEHIPDVQAAVSAAVRTARRYVMVTVPSKPDNNPEHIHLLTKDILTDLFRQAGCEKLSFSGVPGHLVLIAAV